MPSKSKLPATGRTTIEVDISWLESQDAKPDDVARADPKKKTKKLPPPVPGARKKGPPPMPVPPSVRPARRETMEVKAEWLEKDAARDSDAPRSKKRVSRTSVPAPASNRPRRAKGPPIPRED